MGYGQRTWHQLQVVASFFPWLCWKASVSSPAGPNWCIYLWCSPKHRRWHFPDSQCYLSIVCVLLHPHPYLHCCPRSWRKSFPKTGFSSVIPRQNKNTTHLRKVLRVNPLRKTVEREFDRWTATALRSCPTCCGPASAPNNHSTFVPLIQTGPRNSCVMVPCVMCYISPWVEFISATSPRSLSCSTFLNGFINWSIFFLCWLTADLQMASKAILYNLIFHFSCFSCDTQMSGPLWKPAVTTRRWQLLRFWLGQ